MMRTRWLRIALALGISACLLVTASAEPEKLNRPPSPAPAPAAPKFTPKFDAVAETSLLMDGLAQANYRGLEKNLKQKPGDVETWTFVRGQALLIAETGNLLLLRPPRNKGQDAWYQNATDLREAAAELARHAGNRDYDRSQNALTNMANTCNRCHQTFRVPVHVGPGAEGAEKGKERDKE
jgi:hypothetical protein